MKKNFIKTAFAIVCVVVAGIGSYKAYSSANQSEANQLLAENVEALSQMEIYDYWCKISPNGTCVRPSGLSEKGIDNYRYPGWEGNYLNP